MIYVNEHLRGKAEVEINEANFPCLFIDGKQTRTTAIYTRGLDLIVESVEADKKTLQRQVEDYINNKIKELEAYIYDKTRLLNALKSMIQ